MFYHFLFGSYVRRDTEAGASGVGGWDTPFQQGSGDVCGPKA